MTLQPRFLVKAALTPELVRGIFGLDADVMADPHAGTPMVVPHVRA